jgi:hypothetical protein
LVYSHLSRNAPIAIYSFRGVFFQQRAENILMVKYSVIKVKLIASGFQVFKENFMQSTCKKANQKSQNI